MFVRILITLALLCSPVLAKELVLKVTPVEKITTSNEKLQEGDYVKFKAVNTIGKIKEGETITGLITLLEPNGFFGKEAMLSVEQFSTSDSQKLNGSIYAKGNQHNQIMEFNGFIGITEMWFRGGEVTLLPDKDVFLLYMEN